MNSANDVGKRLLPLGIRSAFTEFFVTETSAADQLRLIIRGQISTLSLYLVESVLQFYTEVRAQFPGKFKWVNSIGIFFCFLIAFVCNGANLPEIILAFLFLPIFLILTFLVYTH